MKLVLHNIILDSLQNICFNINNIISKSMLFFTFSYPFKVEKALFLGQFSEVEILMALHILKAPDSENHVFKSGLCVSVISITQK